MNNCAVRPSARVTGTIVPLSEPSDVATLSVYAPDTPYCCSMFWGVIAWTSREHCANAPAETRTAGSKRSLFMKPLYWGGLKGGVQKETVPRAVVILQCRTPGG